MKLELEDFKPVTMEDRRAIVAFNRRHPPVHSEAIHTAMVTWMSLCTYRYVIRDDHLFLVNDQNGQLVFRLPSGPRDRAAVSAVFRLARAHGAERAVGLVDTEYRDWVSREFPLVRFEPHREFWDYVYLVSDLAELPGKNYIKLRNKANSFRKKYGIAVEPITDDNLDEARRFLGRWCLWKDCDKDPMLVHERSAVTFAMDRFEELGLEGLLLRVDGEVQALSVYERMTPDTAVIHYEKAIADYRGIYQAINQETARVLAPHYRFVNRQSDLGIEGLREVKTLYRPHHMVEVHHIRREDLPA